jgi:hypothetical protein
MKVTREVEFDLDIDDIIDIFDRSELLEALDVFEERDEEDSLRDLIRSIEPLWKRKDVHGIIELISSAAWEGPGISLPPLQVKP